jgi:hypothetical protein
MVLSFVKIEDISIYRYYYYTWHYIAIGSFNDVVLSVFHDCILLFPNKTNGTRNIISITLRHQQISFHDTWSEDCPKVTRNATWVRFIAKLPKISQIAVITATKFGAISIWLTRKPENTEPETLYDITRKL